MIELDESRKRIDEIDRQLVELIEERMNIAYDVAVYKKQHGLAVFQKSRELQVLQQAREHVKCAKYEPDVLALLKSIMNLSKTHQMKIMNDVKIIMAADKQGGFYGELYSYCHQVYQEHYGSKGRNFLSFKSGFEALYQGEIDFLIVPVENSITGLVIEVVDLLKDYHFYITKEYYLKIDHVLLGKPGTQFSDIKELYSHGQAISQCSEYLSDKSWKIHQGYSTSESAKIVSESAGYNKVAIASEVAGNGFGLVKMESAIQNNLGNQTRFIVLKREQENKCSQKISIMFSLDHQPGTLSAILNLFADASLNLIKIESRPSHNTNWEYLSIVDFEGDIAQENVLKLLDTLKEMTVFYKFLGAF